MTLRSMTGFAREDGRFNGGEWAWEIRSVNGKGFDIRFRWPQGLEHLEQYARKRAADHFARGNFQASLTLDRVDSVSAMRLDEQALDTVFAAVKTIDARGGTAPSTAAQILALRGVLDTQDNRTAKDTLHALHEPILEGFSKAAEALAKARTAEGTALREVLTGHIEKIAALVARAAEDPSRTPEAIRERLADQIARIDTSAKDALDTSRLHQEAVLLAAKADIQEELDRLSAHCEAARELISNGSPVGRKLEFLAQEFNRETNTLCAKSNSVSLTAIGLELKAVIDQFREQILNVE